MRKVVYEDRNGWLRAALVRDSDPDEAAPMGLPVTGVDIGNLDCEAVKKDINNYLVKSGVFDWSDVQREQNSIARAIKHALHKRVVDLFRMDDLYGQEDITNE